jgi:competence protein ComEA
MEIVDPPIENFKKYLIMYKIPIIVGIVGIVLLCISIMLFIRSMTLQEPIVFREASFSSELQPQVASITVDVEGAVVHPGVYSFIKGSRIGDAIERSGGLQIDADISYISKTVNKAQILDDGMKLYIPKNAEMNSGQNVKGISSSQESTLVSINSANSSELEALSGIGVKTAEKIINSRPYGNLEELVSKGILYRSIYEKLKNQLSL